MRTLDAQDVEQQRQVVGPELDGVAPGGPRRAAEPARLPGDRAQLAAGTGRTKSHTWCPAVKPPTRNERVAVAEVGAPELEPARVDDPTGVVECRRRLRHGSRAPPSAASAAAITASWCGCSSW